MKIIVAKAGEIMGQPPKDPNSDKMDSQIFIGKEDPQHVSKKKKKKKKASVLKEAKHGLSIEKLWRKWSGGMVDSKNFVDQITAHIRYAWADISAEPLTRSGIIKALEELNADGDYDKAAQSIASALSMGQHVNEDMITAKKEQTFNLKKYRMAQFEDNPLQEETEDVLGGEAEEYIEEQKYVVEEQKYVIEATITVMDVIKATDKEDAVSLFRVKYPAASNRGSIKSVKTEEEFNREFKDLTSSTDNKIVEAKEGWPKDVKKGRFTEYCKGNGFEGACIECAKKAMDSDDESVRGMATFYMNTVKPKGKDAGDV